MLKPTVGDISWIFSPETLFITKKGVKQKSVWCDEALCKRKVTCPVLKFGEEATMGTERDCENDNCESNCRRGDCESNCKANQ